MSVRLGTPVMLLLVAMVAATGRAQDDPVRELEQKLDATRPASGDAGAAGVEAGELPAPSGLPAPGPAVDVAPMSRPSLGISVVDITELTRRRFGITVNHGAVISQVRAGYPAARAGLPLGGVIVSINGQRIGSAQELVAVIQAFQPGEEIEITYFEGDRIGRKKVRLTPAVAAPAPTGPPVGPARRSEPPLKLGGRQPGERPILDALERALGALAPPAGVPGAPAGEEPREAPLPEPPLPPPPPPPPPPDASLPEAPLPALDAPDLPLPAAEDVRQELRELRQQLQLLRQQLDQLQRRLEALEQNEHAE